MVVGNDELADPLVVAEPRPEPTRPPRWTWLVPGGLALAVLLTGLGTPSLWRDEAATISVARRPLPDILRLLGNIDAVHGMYYLMMHPIIAVFGTNEWALRLPSALAGAVAAGGVAAIGARLCSARAGVLAGSLCTVAPMFSRAGQDARSYALVMALAVLASLLLVVAAQTGSGRWFVAYAAMTALLGIAHLIAALLLAAHGATLLVHARRAVLVRWLAAAGAALTVIAPLAVLASTQQTAISWMRPPGTAELDEVVTALTGSFTLIVPITLLIRSRGTAPVVVLALPWLVLPPVVLLTVSLVHPFYNVRYLLFCLPAAALLAGAGLARFRLPVQVVALVAVVAIAMPSQLAVRRPEGHLDDLRTTEKVLRALGRPGDAVVYLEGFGRSMSMAYPTGFSRLRDVGLARSPRASATIDGLSVPDSELRYRLKTTSRVWLLTGLGHKGPAAPEDERKVAARAEALHPDGSAYVLVERRQVRRLLLSLYERRPSQ
ncbi:glycosyltransferase family 39 protein [Actinomadura roseirufa]|uniref:glycosyltransferase family 39 protein n=1 Tax=Actinomadura roseirufa TaxID=2094049 RepID=UPI00104154F0|nr:glycosyltransferase family 39 protein [Actinomadura roseirufa]